MRDDRYYLLRAIRHEHVGSLNERAAGVCHVVDQDRDAAVDVADERHARDFVRLGPLLVDQGEVEVETVGESGGTLGAAGVGGDDDGVFIVEVLADVAESCRFRVEAVLHVSACVGMLGVERGEGGSLIDGHIEEALDLTGMQVHGDDMVAASAL